MLKKIQTLFVMFLMVSMVTACVDSPRVGGYDVSAEDARKVSSISYGTIVSVQGVKVQEQSNGKSLVYGASGALIGGVLGSLIGGGTGKTLATVGGALAGALAGQGVNKATSTVQGYQLDIRLDSGETISLVQGDDIKYHSGQRVKLIYDGTHTRVLPM